VARQSRSHRRHERAGVRGPTAASHALQDQQHPRRHGRRRHAYRHLPAAVYRYNSMLQVIAGPTDNVQYVSTVVPRYITGTMRAPVPRYFRWIYFRYLRAPIQCSSALLPVLQVILGTCPLPCCVQVITGNLQVSK